ncbi:MAG: NAD(P)H-binding protein, partial [Acidimicrobiia bacterium]
DRLLQPHDRRRPRFRCGGHSNAGGCAHRAEGRLKTVLIGGGGQVGRLLQPILVEDGHEVAVAGRTSDVPVDLTTGAGLATAVEHADVVVLLASDPRAPEATDVAGTRRLLDVLEGQHLVYLSIVGVDRHPLPYYRAKYEAEMMISDSGAAHTIMRATQFHGFVEWKLQRWCHRWLATIPAGYVYQPVAIEEVASELARLATGEPKGRASDFGGPEVLPMETMARSYMTARGREAPVLRYPAPGSAAAGYRRGLHTNPERAVGSKTWASYLEERFDR